VWHVSVLSSTQSLVGVLVNPHIMVAVSGLLYGGSYCPYYGVPSNSRNTIVRTIATPVQQFGDSNHNMWIHKDAY